MNQDLNLSKKFCVYVAGNCFEALGLIHSNFLQNNYISLIITDEYMPYMKGSTMIKLLKNLSKEDSFYNITFVSYTSFDTNEKKKYILDQGADHIINKPIAYDLFKLFINDLVNTMIKEKKIPFEK